MAVDTRMKRLSMLNFGNGDLLTDPSGSVNTAARANLLRLYYLVNWVATAGRTITIGARSRTITINVEA